MTERREWTAIIGITALAVLCRLAVLGQPMRFDESVSWAYYVGRSWQTIVATYQYPNNHVLFSLLARLSGAPASYAPWALRLPAFIAGIAIVPLTWAVARRFADTSTALFAAALTVGSTELVLYSTNARGYTLVVALFLSMLIVADMLRSQPSSGKWIALVLLGAAGLYTIPVMLYPIGIVMTWLALSSLERKGDARRNMLVHIVVASAAIGVIAALLYLPIMRSAGVSAVTGNKFVTPSTWPDFGLELPGMVGSTLAHWSSPLPWWCTPVVAVLALLGLLRTRPRTRPSLALAAGLWCGVLLLATHRAPFVRVWMFLLPLFLISVVRGVTWCAHRVSNGLGWNTEWTSFAVGVVMLAAAMWTHAAERSDDTGAFRPAELIATTLGPRLRPTDRVLAPIPTFGPMLYYLGRAGEDTTLLTIPIENVRRAFLVLDTRHGQSLTWAIEHHMIDPTAFANPNLLARYPDGELWETRRQ